MTSDEQTTGRQLAAARVLLGLAPADIATRAGISEAELARIEASEGLASAASPADIAAVRTVLEGSGIEFIEADGGGAGVRLRGREDGAALSVDELNAQNDA